MNMIKINRTKKSKLSIFSTAVLAVVLLASCSNMFQTKKDNPASNSQLPDYEMGIITVKVNDGNARTILPSTDDFKVENLTNIKLEGNWQDGETQTVIAECTDWATFQTNATTAVQTGNWIFTLTAKLGNVTFTGTQGTSTAPVTIVKDTTTTLAFTLATTTTYGGLSLGITMTSGDATKIDATLKTARSGGSVVDEQTLTLSAGAATYAISIDGQTSKNQKLTAGTYYLELAFKTSDTSLPTLNTWKGIVHIEKGITTTSSISWSTDQVYEIQFTDNGGVLSGGGSVTPISFTRKSSEITLPQMTKSGYYFEGWYKDSDFTANKKIETIPTGTTGDQPVYARFIKKLYVTYSGASYSPTYSDGSRPASAFATINDAITKIKNITDDTSSVNWIIEVHGTIGNDEDSQLVSSDFTTTHATSLTIQGGIDDFPAGIIDGCGSETALKILTSIPVTVSNLTITGGSNPDVVSGDDASGKGGGLYTTGTVTLSGVEISGNTAAYGGGIYAASGSSVTVDGCVITNNTANGVTTSNTGVGGGICAASGSSVTLKGSTQITSNKAYKGTNTNYSSAYGGGIYVDNASFSITASSTITINSNLAERAGSGIYLAEFSDNKTLSLVSGTTISKNSATGSSGGGIYVSPNWIVTIPSGVTMEENSAYCGGGIYNYGTVNLNGCTLGSSDTSKANKTSGTSGNNGGAIYNCGIVNMDATATIPSTGTEKYNDVYVNVYDSVDRPINITESISSQTGTKASISCGWTRGTKIITTSAGVSLSDADLNKFVLLGSGTNFNKLNTSAGTGDTVRINSPIYVAASGGSIDNKGYIDSPYNAAALTSLVWSNLGKDVPGEVIIDGNVILSSSITISTTNPSSITIYNVTRICSSGKITI